jgi:hypothetical protein
MKKMILVVTVMMLAGIDVSAQLNPATNAPLAVDPLVAPHFNTSNESRAAGISSIPCTSTNTFWGIGGGGIDQLTIGDSTVIFDSTIIAISGGTLCLAYCNNLNGGSPNPTFYGYSGYFTPAYYGDTGWVSCPQSYNSWILNGGGYGEFLYYTTTDTPAYITNGVVRYDGHAFTQIYLFSDTGKTVSVADIAVDSLGNFWMCTHQNHNGVLSDSVNYISGQGVLLAQYPTSNLGTNAYGMILANGKVYVGLGASNLQNPSTLVPLTITADSAIAGRPLPMTTTYADLASCTPGLPAAIEKLLNIKSLNVFPNPADNNFSITGLSVDGIGTLSLLDETGKLVYKSPITATTMQIDASGFASGIYFVQARSGDKISTFKLVVQH